MFKLASIQTEYLEQRGNVIFRIWMGDTFVRAQEREREGGCQGAIIALVSAPCCMCGPMNHADGSDDAE
jgi:hypothetical protein